MRRRYQEEEQSQLFDQAIGDGQLWLALLGAWNLLPSGTTEELLQQVTLFRDFVTRGELLGSAEQSRVTGLFSAFWSAEVIEAARSRALRFGSSLRDLERALERSYEELKSGQASMQHIVVYASDLTEVMPCLERQGISLLGKRLRLF